MIPYPHISPEIVRVGPLAVRWYGIMYLLGFVSSYALVAYQIKKKSLDLDRDFLESLYTSLVFVLIIGARLSYDLFSDPAFYLQHPLAILALRVRVVCVPCGLVGPR